MPLATPEWSVELRDKILKQSRQRYAQEKSALENLMNAWNKKTYSPQEKVVAKAQFEAIGLENDEIANLQEPFIEENMSLFNAYAINGRQPDAIIFDIKLRKHKGVWYSLPEHLEADAYFLKTLNSMKIYNHGSLKDGKWDALMLLIGDRESIKQQASKSDTLKFVPNIYLLENNTPPSKIEATKTVPKNHTEAKNKITTPSNMKNPAAKPTNNTITKSNTNGGKFSIKDITLGEQYTGYVKLLYNYGIFVTVKGVEWLLHKKAIKIPEWVEWKKYFNIGDQINVYAREFKDIKGEKKVVREMR